MIPQWLRPTRHAPYVLAVYASRALAGFIMAAPFAAAATQVVGEWPGGGAVLAEPGGVMLLETVRLQIAAIRSGITQSALILTLMIPVSLVTSTMLLVSLSEAGRVRLPAAMERCGRHLGPIAIAWVVMTLLAGGVGFFFYILAELLSRKLSGGLGYRGGDIAYVCILAVGLIGAFAVMVVHDLVRASIVAGRRDALLGIALGWRVTRSRWIEAAAALWPRAAASVLLVLLALLLCQRTSGAVSVVVQQTAAMGLVLLRASWLARAVELTGEAQGVARDR